MADCYRERRTSIRSEEAAKDPDRINVMFICDEWNPSKGGLSTFNREIAVNLVKTSSDKIKVHCFVAQSDDTDREDARLNGVNLLTAQTIRGTANRLDWLKIPPQELPDPDVVIGHGRKFGLPALFIKRMTTCKWMQFLHVFCPDLGKYKSSKSSADHPAVDTINENEEKHKHEIELCEVADGVVAVGPGLKNKYTRCLPDTEVGVFTPGIIHSFSMDPPPRWQLNYSDEDKLFSCLVFGRAAPEDLRLKGYDIIANAVGALGENFRLLFVGSTPGKQREIEKWFLKKTKITRDQLTVHGYVDQHEVKKKLRETDLVVLPSRAEAFGLAPLEAISAGVPVLISKNAGIAQALRKVEGGSSVIVESDDPEEWAQRILLLSRQSPMERHNSALNLRENYKSSYSWETECKKFSVLIENLRIKAAERVEHDKENVGQLPQEDLGPSQRVPHVNGKRPHTEVDVMLENNNPAVLQQTVWWFLGRMFGHCSHIESRGLRWGDVFLEKDPKTGNERLALKIERSSKSHQCQVESESQAMQVEAVRSYKEFESHRPIQMNKLHSPFYLAVKRKIKNGDQVWYMNKAQGVRSIGKTQSKSKRPRLSQLCS